jgi:nicotinic acid mononucleotide adenylyltransferase
MDLIRRPVEAPAKLAIFPGTFNPPTRAHLALGEAALGHADEVLFVLPRAFPHKQYEKVGFTGRLRLLEEALAPYPRFSLAVSTGGLFIDIARESRQHYPRPTELLFLCGRDAAERIVNWDYGDPEAFRRQCKEYHLLVARRGNEYTPPPGFAACIHQLSLPADWDEVSATTVRERLATGEQWQHLVPPQIVPLVEKLYRP